ncbi:hypothetical protein QQS21_009994 [Conoideocrella luteorostrata]|uniref:Mannan endo-1,6-alpha-mannosidase n=1 Tax=Conoideocrella luteorostrata TaxID=1105319 RepID=A0AAJ0FUL4_9HYPO|nr:hypothetical protein QQS21_009994 [Conoideocrella luteorostrata]
MGFALTCIDQDNIRQSAGTLAFDLIKLYKGNESGQIPGVLPGPPPEGPYFWWQGGAMMATYIDYWRWTGDSTYNRLVAQGMLHQVGENINYMPNNHTLSLGNDDQGFWGMAALLAAENQFPDPPSDQPQWLELAQAVWATQADPSRHDEACNGGLRWQIPFANTGYDYKNTISNGIFFNMGARLARYTGNDTYAQRAEDSWNWIWGVKYIDHETWSVYDGSHVQNNCTVLVKTTYSYNAAILAQGAAYMYNYVSFVDVRSKYSQANQNRNCSQTNGEERWKSRLDSLLDNIFKTFFHKGAAFEVACEQDNGQGTCNRDMNMYKGFLHRWLAVTSQVAPYTQDKILPMLRKSAETAVKQCTGGESGRQCGLYWTFGRYVDPAVAGTSGAGEVMNVLAAVSALLVNEAKVPVTNTTGGTSKGNPNAGGKDNGERPLKPITAADKAGAAIITIILLAAISGLFIWMTVF